MIDLGPLIRARFLTRPNRFLVRCSLAEGGRTVRAFLPNPGRLLELLLPGVPLWLRRPSGPGAEGRKTRFTVVATERDGQPVFLHTHLSNDVARHLLEQRLVPGFEAAEVVRAEARHGRSRFDFLLRERGREVFLEVKSVTLFGNGVAMFPDAVTERGRRHLEELAALSRPEARPGVLFLVHHPRVRWFLPDYHTDLAFARTVLAVRKRLRIVPLAVGWDEHLSLTGTPCLLEVPWGFLRRHARDRGAYLLVLRLARTRRIAVGALGSLTFPGGYYVYVGSAMQNLEARLARHRRLRKRHHWHVDALRAACEVVAALPIRTAERVECDLAAAASRVLDAGVPGFGASDCGCETHLFHHRGNPLDDRAFHDMIQAFRMTVATAPFSLTGRGSPTIDGPGAPFV